MSEVHQIHPRSESFQALSEMEPDLRDIRRIAWLLDELTMRRHVPDRMEMEVLNWLAGMLEDKTEATVEQWEAAFDSATKQEQPR
ncbi:hypothetical protein [Ferruginivarius sediminum]|uniref:Uncharacterized protein n=1 Tax=Ferruginivarius sediminum TaxID=2661937 RepID=A0A369TBG2_9PROT|nr:hypothetical protein [Ferruginivarius sediminum]RDD62618.1 hypothetical protein DRB17_05505 [Ferruginivarius sediminum]